MQRTTHYLREAALLIAIPTLAGCPLGQIQPPPEKSAVNAVTLAQPANVPMDAPLAQQAAFHVDVFRIATPRGTYSTNEEFWKRIDEQCVDVATADLLYKNGVRVGLAPISEFDHFTSYLGGNEPVQRLAIAGMESKTAQIELKQNIQEQTIFYFDRANIAQGRAFDRSENLLNLAFEPAMRKPGQLRVSLCPMVRATRRKMQFTRLNDEYEIQFVNPEIYYDLNFRVDVPPDTFLIVTPSPDASRPTSVGNAFFMKDSLTQQMEDVLLIVPKMFVSAGPAKEVQPNPGKPVKQN